MQSYESWMEERATRYDTDEETHDWRDSTHNDCCSCGWRCDRNSTGTHNRTYCLTAHKRHAARLTAGGDDSE